MQSSSSNPSSPVRKENYSRSNSPNIEEENMDDMEVSKEREIFTDIKEEESKEIPVTIEESSNNVDNMDTVIIPSVEKKVEICGYYNAPYIQLCESYENLSTAEEIVYEIFSKDLEIIPFQHCQTEENTPVASPPAEPVHPSDIPSITPPKVSESSKTVEITKEIDNQPKPETNSKFWEPTSGSLRDILNTSNLNIKPPITENTNSNESPTEAETSQLNSKVESSEEVDKTILVLRISSKANATMRNCYNCNTPVSSSGFGSNARFCEYFGEYFCKQCHLNQESIIPAHIIHQWDFGRYKVSDLALRTLRTSIDLPVIPVPKSLYTMSKRMARIKELR